MGASFTSVTPELERRLNLQSGVLAKEVDKAGFFEQLGMRSGAVISFINSKPVRSPDDIEEQLSSTPNARMQIIAIGPDGITLAFNFSLGT